MRYDKPDILTLTVLFLLIGISATATVQAFTG